MKKQIYLIGYMGCGKSTLGVALAKSLGWSFEDLDKTFETKHHCLIADYFKEFGEDGFRVAEREVLKESMQRESVVYATGGGMPCFFDNMELINQSGLSIYLKLPAEALVKRLTGGKQHRPLIADKSDSEMLEFISQKLKEREPFYSQAQLIVEDSGLLTVSGYVNLIKSSDEMKAF